MDFRIVIPVRYNNAGPLEAGKALMEVAGKPLIQHVYELAIESGAQSVVIATEDEKIFRTAQKFNAQVCMTSISHRSGTERLAEAVAILGYESDEIVLNLHADAVLMPPVVLHELALAMHKHDNVKIATLCTLISNTAALLDTQIVKVVKNQKNYALYFSRAPIAWEREHFHWGQEITTMQEHFRHIGTYAYRVRFLEEYVAWEPSPLESMEQLEQLRVLWHGGRILVIPASQPVPKRVTTPEDLARVRDALA